MLSDARRAQLARIAENEARYDALPDDVIRENRALAAGTLDVLPPLRSASEWASERARLQQIANRQWDAYQSQLRRYLEKLADDRGCARRLANDCRWLLSEWRFTRKQIEACEQAMMKGAA